MFNKIINILCGVGILKMFSKSIQAKLDIYSLVALSLFLTIGFIVAYQTVYSSATNDAEYEPTPAENLQIVQRCGFPEDAVITEWINTLPNDIDDASISDQIKYNCGIKVQFDIFSQKLADIGGN
ncbi:MAG: hypothetical protein L0H53_16730 [Candidatus Nitrosocosmicus sp.]|nr:hypothetical protein [Candidatus Nitrosocosmicus sp.]MDN5868953.1 hypothetical protein [Candidatus Nitrosocosmicus sp.]